MPAAALETSRRAAAEPLLLDCQAISKRYAVTVLDDVSFQLRSGEIHALLGANGAGKSTLCKIIAGLTAASGGTMTLGGQPYRPANKRAAETAGVQIVQQELNQIGTLTVAENLLLGRWPQRFGRLDRRQLHRRARAALQRLQLSDLPLDQPVARCGIGVQQMLEIAAALDRQCRLLILDEPTASLSPRESERLFQQLRLLRDAGVGLIYISHRLDEIAALADRITVLRDGRRVTTQPAAQLDTAQMVRLMTQPATIPISGDPAAAAAGEPSRFEFVPQVTDRVMLSVRQLSRQPAFINVSLDVRGGERLGIAGLVGAGRTELLRAIFGADAADSGTVTAHPRPGQTRPAPQRFVHPSQAVAAGLAMITEDRKQTGLLLEQSITDNITLNSLSRLASRIGAIAPRKLTAAAERMQQQLDIRCHRLEQPAGTLSGGNQQKVVIAKWLTKQSEILLFDEPTRGVDVAARWKIYQQMQQLAAAGKAQLIVSSDLDELLEICDRIVVLSAGRLAGEFHRGNWSREAIDAACFQGYLQPT